MTSVQRARPGLAVGAAWLAAWVVAAACGGGPAVDRGVESSGSIVGAHPGGHRDPAPLTIPPFAQTEIFDDVADPDEASSHSWSVVSRAIRAAGRTDDAGLARGGFDSHSLVANAADLSRLCRLQL